MVNQACKSIHDCRLQLAMARSESSSFDRRYEALEDQLYRALEVNRKLKTACRKLDSKTRDASRIRFRANVETKMEALRQEVARLRHKEKLIKVHEELFEERRSKARMQEMRLKMESLEKEKAAKNARKE